MKLLAGVIITMTGIVPVAAQTAPDIIKESTVTVGTSYQRLTDQFILSYPVTGSTVSAGYHFTKASDRQKLNVSLQGSFGSSSNRYTDVKTQSLSLQFAQGFSLLKTGNGKLNSYWGYALTANPSFTKARYKDDVRYSRATFNDLSLYQSLVYNTGRNKLTWDISVPIIGLSSRPAEKASWHNTTNGMIYDSYSDLFFTSWKNRQAVSSSLEIRRALGKQIDLVFGADLRYNTVKGDYYYKEMQAGIYGGISLSFK